GVAIGYRPSSFRQHRAVPGFPIALEAIEDVFPPILQIRPLARVLNDIEEELVAGNLEIFPVAIADGALPSAIVAPEQFARMRRSAAGHHREQVLPVRRIRR